ncbi:MAG TPA: hypothetical protein VGN00_04670 [Puia sp.]
MKNHFADLLDRSGDYWTVVANMARYAYSAGEEWIRRLRISFLRTPTIDFIAHCPDVQELVLEYVSGFSDLSPLRALKRLKSLHLENLRRVSSFAGLQGIDSLRYLFIGGTLDWNQPIEDFNFFAGLLNLEVFQFRFIRNQFPYPALLSTLHLTKLKTIHYGETICGVCRDV